MFFPPAKSALEKDGAPEATVGSRKTDVVGNVIDILTNPLTGLGHGPSASTAGDDHHREIERTRCWMSWRSSYAGTTSALTSARLADSTSPETPAQLGPARIREDHPMRKTIAVASLTGALLVGGATGILAGDPLLSGAQTTPSTTTAPAESAASVERPAPGAWMVAALAPLVSDRTITQAQADAVAAAVQAARPQGGPGGQGPGHLRGAGMQAVAVALGITAEELRTAVESGQTLGQLADSKGISRTALVDAMVAEADARQAEMRIRITEGLDKVRPVGPGPGPGHGRGMGGPHMGGQPADTTITPTPAGS